MYDQVCTRFIYVGVAFTTVCIRLIGVILSAWDERQSLVTAVAERKVVGGPRYDNTAVNDLVLASENRGDNPFLVTHKSSEDNLYPSLSLNISISQQVFR